VNKRFDADQSKCRAGLIIFAYIKFFFLNICIIRTGNIDLYTAVKTHHPSNSSEIRAQHPNLAEESVFLITN
jgi:hypothetical protein